MLQLMTVKLWVLTVKLYILSVFKTGKDDAEMASGNRQGPVTTGNKNIC